MASDDDLFGEDSQDVTATQPNIYMGGENNEGVDDTQPNRGDRSESPAAQNLQERFGSDDEDVYGEAATQPHRTNGASNVEDEHENVPVQRAGKATRTALDSSSDEEPKPSGNRDVADLFSSGDESDGGLARGQASGSDEEEAGNKGKNRYHSQSEGEAEMGGSDLHHGELFGSDMSGAEEELENAEPVHVEITAPKLPRLEGESLVLAQLPNFLSIETKPFDAETYDEADVEEIRDEDGKTRVRLRVENTIRWRYKSDDNGGLLMDEEGQPIKESNAKIVKWSDGSMSLAVGSEVFDIKEKPLDNEFNHLFVRNGNTLSAQACFESKYNFVLSSFQSLTHKKLAETVAGKTKKAIRTKVLELNEDPRKRLKEMQQKEEDKLKTRRQIEAKRKKVRNAVQYLEEGYNDEYDEEFGGERGDSNSENERDRERRLRQAKRQYDTSEEENEEEEDENSVDVESEAEAPRRKPKKPAELFDTDSDEEDDTVVKKRAKKKQRIESDESDE